MPELSDDMLGASMSLSKEGTKVMVELLKGFLKLSGTVSAYLSARTTLGTAESSGKIVANLVSQQARLLIFLSAYSSLQKRWYIASRGGEQYDSKHHFKGICRQYNILDLDGKIYNLTSHQFRHNGITDRLEARFTMEQIADMTGHHGNTMIWNAYSHLNLKLEIIVKKQRCVLKEPLETESKYILFGSRILGMDELLEKRLLKNLRAHRVLGGICGDVTRCKSDTWNCLNCEHFIPDSNQIPYFEEQISLWQEKAKRQECELLRGSLFLLMQRRN